MTSALQQLNATVRETEDVMRQIRSGNARGRFVTILPLHNATISYTVAEDAEDLRAGKARPANSYKATELYNRFNSHG